MRLRRWIILGSAILVIAIVGGGWWYLSKNPSAQSTVMAQLGVAPKETGWTASGFIEADEVDIAPEISGRIAVLPVEEGDEVQAGDLLLHLEDDVLLAQTDLARGKLEEAQATLAQTQAGARQETVARFTAQLALAQAARNGARQAWLDAKSIRDNPQALDVQIVAAGGVVSSTQKQFEAAQIQRDMAEKAWKDYGKAVMKLADIPQDYRPALPPEFYLSPYRWEQALAAMDVAQTTYDGARAALNHLLAQRSQPQEAQAQVDAAFGSYQAAEATVAQAQAALDNVKAGATAEEVAAAQAQVKQAQAALEAAQVQLDKTTIRAPLGGVIAARSVYTGELTLPGVTVMTLTDLDDVTLTIYLPGKLLGQVSLGQAVDVYVDAFPNRAFSGVIVRVSDQAEYTPRNVRTPDQRATLVYGVKIKLANPDHTLKPGLQAEVRMAK
jgi:HlyD family secretion protein